MFKSRAAGSCLSLAGGQRLLDIPRVQLGACAASDTTQGFTVSAVPSGGYRILDSAGRCLTTYSGMLLTGVVAMPCDSQPDKVWDVASLSPGGKVRGGAWASKGAGGPGAGRGGVSLRTGQRCRGRPRPSRAGPAGRAARARAGCGAWRLSSRNPSPSPCARPSAPAPRLQGPFILKARISGKCMASSAGSLVLSSACGQNNNAALFDSASA